MLVVRLFSLGRLWNTLIDSLSVIKVAVLAVTGILL